MAKPAKRATTSHTRERTKKAKVAIDDEPEHDFAFEGYVVLPPPVAVSIEVLQDQLVAHRFSTSDWAPGWCVGIVDAQSKAKRTLGQFEVRYDGFSPAVYIHKLLPSDYARNWCLVKKN